MEKEKIPDYSFSSLIASISLPRSLSKMDYEQIWKVEHE